MNNSPQIMLLAGEASGDHLGANLLKAINEKWPNAHTFGMGGDQMREQGMSVSVDSRDMAIMGAFEVLTHVGKIIRAWICLKKQLKKHKPVVILIDYPGFNLRFAKLAHRLGCKVLYVVSPQIWAWKVGRLKTITHVVDYMAVLFPFEKEIYDKAGVPCSVIKHPLINSTKRSMTSLESYQALGLNPSHDVIALCPGSRQKEIDSLLPIMLEARELILKEKPDAQFVLCLSPTLKHTDLSTLPDSVQIIDGSDHHVLSHANLALVASGTMTLELALLETPMVIAYKLHPISYWLATKCVSTEWVGLCNILMRDMIAPEHLQHEATPEQLADSCLYHLKNQEIQISTWKKLQKSLSGNPISSLTSVIDSML